MFRIIILGILFGGLSMNLQANNVRITKELVITPVEAVTIVDLDFSFAWDNSWRDDYNWDAAYAFLKYRKKGQLEWKHVPLMDNLHTVSDPNLTYWMAKSTATANVCQGIFIYRKVPGSGNITADVRLKWQLTTTPDVKVSDFQSGAVEYMVSFIEMVYIPSGPFMLGDGVYKQKKETALAYAKTPSSNRLKTEYRTILPEWDLIKIDGKIKYESSGEATGAAHYKTYAPSNAANRVSENRSQVYSNAWYGNSPAPYTWTVDFGEDKTVSWFGINGVYNYPDYCPPNWYLYGMKSRSDAGVLLYSGSKADWVMSAYSSYPISKALKIENPKAYRYYQIRTLNNAAMINNISMTEVDLDTKTENLYVVDRQTPIFLSPQSGLSARTGLAEEQASPNWTNTTLSANYPTGFDGFYVMKYEVSQEQYVRFLNTLQAFQQRQRTIGEALTKLDVGDFVYGADHTACNQRNGIVVGAKVDESIMFACNLNVNNEFYKEDDGKTVACNFLSPSDMLAYADWTGLRPLSEMEYEKMARHPYPFLARSYEWAGGDVTKLRMPQLSGNLTNVGTNSEYLADANVNAGGKETGPVRTGSFAANAGGKLAEAGASHWGVMDLSGNLSEMYYNLLPSARSNFQYWTYGHGDGLLVAESETVVTTGNTNMSTSYWPQTPVDFTLRGGNFGSTQQQLAVSDRSNETYFSDLNQKDSTVSFRLGHSYTNILVENSQVPVCTTYLKLQNGRVTTADNVAIDTVCSGDSYTVEGTPLLESSTVQGGQTIDKPMNYSGVVTYLWFIREHELDNTHWQLIQGQYGPNLTLPDLRNDGNGNTDGIRRVYLKRMVVTPTFSKESYYAQLCVVNNTYRFNRLKDTIRSNNQVLGFFAETKVTTSFTWRWKSADSYALPLSTYTGTTAFFAATRENFKSLPGQNHLIVCEVRMMNKCRVVKELEVYVEERPEVIDIETGDITAKGVGPTKSQCGVLMQDTRDGNIYGTVQIGNQCWMAENLRYDMPGFTKRLSRDPKGNYGLMYSLNATVINQACPQGWRLPADADFIALRTYLNQDQLNLVGQKMKAGAYWTWANSPSLGTNSSGFGAMGTGYVLSGTTDSECSTATYFVSTGSYWGMAYNTYDFTGPSGWSTSYHMPVRCIKK